MSVIVCDACGYEQGFAPITVQCGNRVERVYIQCRNCGRQHTAYYTDPEIRNLQGEQRRIAAGKMTDARMKRYRKNKEKLKQMMDELRARMEHPRSKPIGKIFCFGNRWRHLYPRMDM